MSRIVVKNLPAQTTEEDLRKLFSEKGTLTDVDLKRNSSGKSRHFAFIGYHDDRAAVQAIITLNNTFLRTNKIQVERCRNLSKEDPVPSKKKEYENIPRSQAKKRMSLQSNVGKPNKKLKKEHFGPTLVEDILVEKYKSDPKFADFLDLKCAGQAAKVRERLNLVVDSSDSESSNPPLNSESKVKLPAQERTLRRGEVINWLHQVKVSGIPRRTNKMMIKEFFAPLDCRSIRRRGRGSKAAYVGFLTESECKQAFFKHKCYLNGKCVRISKYDGDFKMEKTADGGLPTLRIYFYDFPATTTAKEIQKLFSAQGKLKTLVIAKDEDTNKLKNFGLATYQKKSDAGKAYKKLLKSQFKVVLCPDWSAEVPTENLEECERTVPIFDASRIRFNRRKIPPKTQNKSDKPSTVKRRQGRKNPGKQVSKEDRSSEPYNEIQNPFTFSNFGNFGHENPYNREAYAREVNSLLNNLQGLGWRSSIGENDYQRESYFRPERSELDNIQGEESRSRSSHEYWYDRESYDVPHNHHMQEPRWSSSEENRYYSEPHSLPKRSNVASEGNSYYWKSNVNNDVSQFDNHNDRESGWRSTDEDQYYRDLYSMSEGLKFAPPEERKSRLESSEDNRYYRSKLENPTKNESRPRLYGNMSHRESYSKLETSKPRNSNKRSEDKQYQRKKEYSSNEPQIVHRIHLKNLPTSTSVQDIDLLFRPYGPSSVDIPVGVNNKHRGHGVIAFKERYLAQLAYQELKRTGFNFEMITYTGPANKDPLKITYY